MLSPDNSPSCETSKRGETSKSPWRSDAASQRFFAMSSLKSGASPTPSADSSQTSIASTRSAHLREWARTRRRSSCVSNSSLNDSNYSKCPAVSKTDIKEGNAFIDACREGDVEKVRNMLEAKPLLVNYVEPFMHNYTPLHYAAKKGTLDVVKILVDSGANINAFTYHYTPLHLAAMGGKEAVIRYLEKQPGVKLGLHDGGGRTYEECWSRPEGRKNIQSNDAGKKKVSFRDVGMPSDSMLDLQKSDKTQQSTGQEEKYGTISKRKATKFLKKILN
uniref:ANK_REP_REGION domain-containing protein n=1 Tax=Steinernema glaseri TaxID=37863 RepID=A0A1I7Y2J6_9BILA